LEKDKKASKKTPVDCKTLIPFRLIVSWVNKKKVPLKAGLKILNVEYNKLC
jgi:hypothetical protein